jgi:hypothetical protein
VAQTVEETAREEGEALRRTAAPWILAPRSVAPSLASWTVALRSCHIGATSSVGADTLMP